MIIKSDQARGECDTLDCKGTNTHAAVCQGATGRYCEVLWMCKDCAIQMARGEDRIMSAEDARVQCNNDPQGYADF